jgi:ferredoxin-NADP reductase
VADVVDTRMETPTARTLRLRIPGLRGHLAGQHVDIRLTAPDGYQAVRSYSIASGGGRGALEPHGLEEDELELTVEELADGEVSPYLVRGLQIGDQLELRGPVGGWFVWHDGDAGAVQLIAGGSGIVPLMSMARAHAAAGSSAPFRMLYSLRSPFSGYYTDELRALAAEAAAPLEVDYVYTRQAPPGTSTPAGRLTAEGLMRRVLPASDAPTFFVCGSTPFVEAVAGWLVDAGHDAARVRTERYGGIGGTP